MQICESKKSASGRSVSETEYSSPWMTATWDLDLNAPGAFLHLEVSPDQRGLQVMNIGPESPLRRLRPLGSFNMQGSVESGDRIVAIDGVLTNSRSELIRMIADRGTCEVTIYDHRTRLTVSWKLQLQETLESSHCRPRLLAS